MAQKRNRKYKDWTGTKSGRLTVIAFAGKVDRGGTKWLCRCECGKEVIVRSDAIGHQMSCGCIRNEKNIKRFYRHGDSRLPLYKVHSRILQATSNPNYLYFKNYGGKGVKLCDEWKIWENFRDWSMSHGYAKGMHLHRKDSNGDYCPENCVWISTHEHHMIHGNAIAKVFEQLDDSGNVVATYSSYREIKEAMGLNDTGSIRRSIREGYRCKGYRWRIRDKN